MYERLPRLAPLLAIVSSCATPHRHRPNRNARSGPLLVRCHYSCSHCTRSSSALRTYHPTAGPGCGDVRRGFPSSLNANIARKNHNERGNRKNAKMRGFGARISVFLRHEKSWERKKEGEMITSSFLRVRAFLSRTCQRRDGGCSACYMNCARLGVKHSQCQKDVLKDETKDSCCRLQGRNGGSVSGQAQNAAE